MCNDDFRVKWCTDILVVCLVIENLKKNLSSIERIFIPLIHLRTFCIDRLNTTSALLISCENLFLYYLYVGGVKGFPTMLTTLQYSSQENFNVECSF